MFVRARRQQPVMAGLNPAIHVVLWSARKDVNARAKPGHDAEGPLAARDFGVI